MNEWLKMKDQNVKIKSFFVIHRKFFVIIPTFTKTSKF